MTKTSSRAKEKVVFHAARSIRDPSQRKTYLDAACAGDRQLRERVDALLAALMDAQDFLESPPLEPQDCLATEPDEAIGTVIGSYKLLERIGEGGFGVVYMVDQLEPIQRRMALKIIKLGMDTKQVVARFEAERQALALMEHPNIAKVFDAGETESGRPYFVMELVRGVPVIEYCDDRNLTTEERLKLFVQICSAIQHAHQKGIIHRDIKPTNILVSTNGDVPVPKVIDFGIAKATQGRLTDKTLFTQFRQFVGTPAYMSPEQSQMTNIDVDTRSDIYSLGVLLYELLTGKTPLDSNGMVKAGFEEVCRRIREEDPVKPSKRLSSLQLDELTTLARQRRIIPSQFLVSVRGDLDWIVMKAVEKDRSRRYESCGMLAADIQRYLKNEPVVAGPPSATYHFRKFIQRNRTAVLMMLAIAVSLILGTVVATMGWLQAVDEKKRTELAKNELSEQVIATQDALTEAEKSSNEARHAKELAEAEKQRAITTAYLADMHAAHQALRHHNLGLAKQILKRNRDFDSSLDPRHWEWRALWWRCQGNSEQSFGVPGTEVVSISVHPDGTLLAAAGSGRICIWSVPNEELVATLVVDASNTGRVAFSPAGDVLFAATGDRAIRSWNVPDFTESKLVMNHEHPIVDMKISPDGKWLVALERVAPAKVSQDLDVLVWDVQSGTLRKRFLGGNSGGGGTLAISADSSILGIGIGKIRVLDLQTLKDIRKLEADGRAALAFSPDGKFVASATGLTTPEFQIHQVADGEFVARLEGHAHATQDLVFSPDGQLLASASSDQTVRLWDMTTYQQVAVLQKHEFDVKCLAFSTDGQRLFSGGRDGQICVWDGENRGESNWPTEKPQAVRYGDWYGQHSQVSYSPDGKLLATTKNHYLYKGTNRLGIDLRSPESLEVIQTISQSEPETRGVRFSPADNLLAVGDVAGSLELIDLDEPQQTKRVLLAS